MDTANTALPAYVVVRACGCLPACSSWPSHRARLPACQHSVPAGTCTCKAGQQQLHSVSLPAPGDRQASECPPVVTPAATLLPPSLR